MSNSPSHEQVYDFDIKESTKQKLVFRKYPCIEWSVALAFLSAFAFCEYMICWVNVEEGKFMFHHTWYLVILLTILLTAGLYSLYEGELETIVFDKKSKTMLVRYTNFICKKRYTCEALKNISGIKACIKGHKGPGESEHYILCVYTHSGSMTKVLMSKNPDRIKRQLLAIRKFLAIELEKPISLVDTSTAEDEIQKDIRTRIKEEMR